MAWSKGLSRETGVEMSESGSSSITPEPFGFMRDIVLREGALLTLRALRETDREGLLALFRRCSPQTIRYRFLRLIA